MYMCIVHVHHGVYNAHISRILYKLSVVFESLQKAFSKAKSVVEKEGATPKFYIRALVDLEDFVKEVYVYTCVCDDPYQFDACATVSFSFGKTRKLRPS